MNKYIDYFILIMFIASVSSSFHLTSVSYEQANECYQISDFHSIQSDKVKTRMFQKLSDRCCGFHVEGSEIIREC